MPTKRVRGTRRLGARITAEAVELFREGFPLVAGYIACIESNAMCRHAGCDRLREIFSALHMALALRPWEPSPLNEAGRSLIACPDPGPGYALWQQLRAELMQAANLEKASK